MISPKPAFLQQIFVYLHRPIFKNLKIYFKEFSEIDSNNDELMEFIDGEICLQASPSTTHQRISRKLSTLLEIYFSGKKCEPFIAPFDIILSGEDKRAKNKVIPDISVICDKSGSWNYIRALVLKSIGLFHCVIKQWVAEM